MRKLKVGLIGLGNVSEVHLEAYKHVNQIEVIAGAEIEKDRLTPMVKKWNFKGYIDYKEMLDRKSVV